MDQIRFRPGLYPLPRTPLGDTLPQLPLHLRQNSENKKQAMNCEFERKMKVKPIEWIDSFIRCLLI